MVNAWDRANEKREAREEGFAEGEARARRAIAKSMLKDGIDASVILKCTGLTKEELAAL